MNSLRDKVVLITGASRGIGRAIAVKLAGAGAIVGANYLRSYDSAAALRATDPKRISLLRFDVRDASAVAESISNFIACHGRIDVLVNNAGIFVPDLLVSSTCQSIHDVIATNVLGPAFCSQAVLPAMLKQRSGVIICTSSVAAERPSAGQAVYAMSKGAVEALTRALASEYGRKGIRAICMRLGPIRTEMLDLVNNAAQQDRYLQKTSAGRTGSVDEVADLLLFLLSDMATFITGSCVTCDGGFLIG